MREQLKEQIASKGGGEAPDHPSADYARHYVLKHAAELVGVSERMMRAAVAKGHVRGIRFGNRTLIPGSEVKRLIEELGETVPLEAAE